MAKHSEKSTSANSRSKSRRVWIWAGAAALFVVAVSLIWKLTPLREYADAEGMTQLLKQFRNSPWAPLVLVGLYLFAGLVLFPNTILNGAVVLSFSGYKGPLFAFAGSMIAAMAYYMIGRRFGTKALKKANETVIEQITNGLRKGGLVSVLTVRLVPIAPFSVVNLVSGAARIKWFNYALGTGLALLPGILVVSALGRQIRQVLRDPGAASIAGLVLLALLGAALAYLVPKFVKKKSESSGRERSAPYPGPKNSVESALS